MYLVFAVLFAAIMGIIGFNSGKINANKLAEAAYKQGYKDALYKRPASDDLELVCAGLWLSQLKPGEQ